ncbi:unnamed protein product [Callosobruchus maculatus]|uniref:Uncharacterized protein n=1 Tax=Callosobruchus maculatus TaxID=64391 RepID=A0A653DIJ1_CALMS|nr:unnamed protein product [Callosobruchus maculatus]
MGSAQPVNYFTPQPIGDPNAPVDFLTPGGVPHMGEQQAVLLDVPLALSGCKMYIYITLLVSVGVDEIK